MGNVAEYVVDRLSKLGITDCFGVPGDFSFLLNDAVISHPKIQWVGCSNELSEISFVSISKSKTYIVDASILIIYN